MPSGVEGVQPGGGGPDQWTLETFRQRAEAAKSLKEQLDPSGGTEEAKKWGFFEKPEVNKEALEALSTLSPEQRENIARGAREYMKGLLGKADTSELNPETQKAVQSVLDFLKGPPDVYSQTKNASLSEPAPWRKLSPTPDPGIQPPTETPPPPSPPTQAK